MNILTEYWDDWKNDPYPKDRRMKVLEENRVRGMSSENYRFLMNEIVKKVSEQKENATYLEVGCWHGCSLISAALYNETVKCIGIDNFSEHNKGGTNHKILLDNLEKFELDHVTFIHGDDKLDLVPFLDEEEITVDVYFYDGWHSYESQYTGLQRVLPYLAEDCIIMVDDCNLGAVKRANEDFLSENPEFRTIFEIYGDPSPAVHTKCNWWNGYQIFARGFEGVF